MKKEKSKTPKGHLIVHEIIRLNDSMKAKPKELDKSSFFVTKKVK